MPTQVVEIQIVGLAGSIEGVEPDQTDSTGGIYTSN